MKGNGSFMLKRTSAFILAAFTVIGAFGATGMAAAKTLTETFATTADKQAYTGPIVCPGDTEGYAWTSTGSVLCHNDTGDRYYEGNTLRFRHNSNSDPIGRVYTQFKLKNVTKIQAMIALYSAHNNANVRMLVQRSINQTDWETIGEITPTASATANCATLQTINVNDNSGVEYYYGFAHNGAATSQNSLNLDHIVFTYEEDGGVEPTPVSVNGVTLETRLLEMTVGDTETLRADVSPGDASNKELEWSSSNDGVAGVSAAGVVTAKAEGTAVITVASAENGDYYDECAVTVSPVQFVNINRTFTESFEDWAAASYGYTNTGFDIETEAWGTLRWETVDCTLGNADSDPHNGNKSVRLRTTGNGSLTTGFTLEGVKEIQFYHGGWTSDGGTAQISVLKKAAGGDWVQILSPVTSAAGTLSYQAVTVNGDGPAQYRFAVSGLAGKRISVDDIKFVIDEAASINVDGVALDMETITLEEGETAALNAIISPEGADDKTVTWTSNNTSAANVSNAGVVTANNPGTAVITVKTNDGGFTDTCGVTVTAANLQNFNYSFTEDFEGFSGTATHNYGDMSFTLNGREWKTVQCYSGANDDFDKKNGVRNIRMRASESGGVQANAMLTTWFTVENVREIRFKNGYYNKHANPQIKVEKKLPGGVWEEVWAPHNSLYTDPYENILRKSVITVNEAGKAQYRFAVTNANASAQSICVDDIRFVTSDFELEEFVDGGGALAGVNLIDSKYAAGGTADVILAVYEDGRLSDLQNIGISLNGTDKTVYFDEPVSVEDGKAYKVFVWDKLSGLSPLSAGLSLFDSK
jgi:uncharacterized protein YjdB